MELFQPAFRRTLDALLEMLGSLQDALGELRPVVRDERAACAATIARELRRWHAWAPARRLRRVLA